MTQIKDLKALARIEPTSPNGLATNGHGEPGLATNGYRQLGSVFPDGEPPEASEYVKLLPAIYSLADNEFAGRFLRIFEHVLDPIQVQVDNQPYYFDPMLAPRDVLDYMAMWVGLDPEEAEDWPLARRRARVAAAATLYRLRGTRQGIKQHVGIYSGGLPLIQERTNGFRLDPDARLGVNTQIGDDRPRHFVVTIAVERPDELDMDTLRQIIDRDKPVDTSYALRVVPITVTPTDVTKRMRR
jgi:phage tail-like protein